MSIGDGRLLDAHAFRGNRCKDAIVIDSPLGAPSAVGEVVKCCMAFLTFQTITKLLINQIKKRWMAIEYVESRSIGILVRSFIVAPQYHKETD
jgi:hypothetical protein